MQNPALLFILFCPNLDRVDKNIIFKSLPGFHMITATLNFDGSVLKNRVWKTRVRKTMLRPGNRIPRPVLRKIVGDIECEDYYEEEYIDRYWPVCKVINT